MRDAGFFVLFLIFICKNIYIKQRRFEKYVNQTSFVIFANEYKNKKFKKKSLV